MTMLRLPHTAIQRLDKIANYLVPVTIFSMIGLLFETCRFAWVVAIADHRFQWEPAMTLLSLLAASTAVILLADHLKGRQ
ncbi:MAG: hypothetical protein HY000_28830 [Planctomycetes bacterium]|nr:hypothetical protein [Planctomycetota bacterium]